MLKVPSLAFIGQFNSWVREPRSDRDLLAAPAEYWRSKAKTYPLLCKVALWFASVPLSSVAAERAIALMREIETPKRSRLKEPQWHAENFIRYNKWLTQLDFDAVSSDVKTLEAAIRSPHAAAAAAVIAADSAPFSV